MKKFLKDHLEKSNILEIEYKDIKRLIEGEIVLNRIPFT